MSLPIWRACGARFVLACRGASAVLLHGLLWVIGLLASDNALALSDEIDVYTGDLAPPGKLDLTVHANEVADDSEAVDSGGGLIPDHALTSGTEWAYGAAPWLEIGLFTPIVTIARDASRADRRLYLDGWPRSHARIGSADDQTDADTSTELKQL